MSSFLEDIELASKVNEIVKKYEEENKKLAEENIHLSMLNCELEHWLKEHKQRIDNTIEYIKNCSGIYKNAINEEKEMVSSKIILEIL